MAKLLVSDVATTTLATGISEGATSCTVAAGNGALFPQPNPTTGTYFLATFVSASNPNTKELVTCTARSTDTMTITPTTQAWNAGDTFAILNAAEVIQALVQFDDLQKQAGNYALDTGSANAYVVTLSPALAAPTEGVPIRWKAGHTNTGASTLNGQPLVLTNGSALAAGDIVASGIYTSMWNATLSAYQLDYVIITTFSQLSGTVSNAQVPSGAVLQYLTEILASAALTGVPTAPTAASGTNTTQIATTAFADTAATNAAAAAANPGASIGSPGYQAFLSGLILQWGSFTSNGGTEAVSFPQLFPNNCFNVQLTAGVAGYTAGATSKSRSGFSALTSQIGSGVNVDWFAIGN